MMAGSVPETGGGVAAGLEPIGLPPRQHRFREYFKVVLVTILVAVLLKTFVVEAFRIPSGSMENTLLVGDYLLVNKLAYGFRTPSHVPFTNIPLPSFRIPFVSHIRRGDVLVFEYPGAYNELRPQSTVDYVKRSVGLPGDSVRIVRGNVLVNGNPLAAPPYARPISAEELASSSLTTTNFPPGTEYTQSDYGPVIVPKSGDTLLLRSDTICQWRMLIEREGHTVLVDDDGRIYIDGYQTDRYVVSRDYYFVLGDNRDNSLDSRSWGFVPSDNIVGEAFIVYWSWNSDRSRHPESANTGNIRWRRIGTIIR